MCAGVLTPRKKNRIFSELKDLLDNVPPRVATSTPPRRRKHQDEVLPIESGGFDTELWEIETQESKCDGLVEECSPPEVLRSLLDIEELPKNRKTLMQPVTTQATTAQQSASDDVTRASGDIRDDVTRAREVIRDDVTWAREERSCEGGGERSE